MAGTKLLGLLPLSLFFTVAGTKLLGLLPLSLIFYGCGHKTAFFVTNQTPFSSSRAPRTLLGERYPLFFSVCGLQEPSLATAPPLFLC
jgi:hypothetical protein